MAAAGKQQKSEQTTNSVNTQPLWKVYVGYTLCSSELHTHTQTQLNKNLAKYIFVQKMNIMINCLEANNPFCLPTCQVWHLSWMSRWRPLDFSEKEVILLLVIVAVRPGSLGNIFSICGSGPVPSWDQRFRSPTVFNQWWTQAVWETGAKNGKGAPVCQKWWRNHDETVPIPCLDCSTSVIKTHR